MKILKTFTEDIDLSVYAEENGELFLDLESVAIGLGFVDRSKVSQQVAKTYVRWNTVNKYLEEIECESFTTSGDRKLIPEWAFYMLAMKAKNEAAKKFQMKVAKDILPSIRKNGFYISDNITPNQLARLQYTVKNQQKKLRILEAQNEILDKQNDKLIEALARKTSTYRSWYYGK